MVDGTEDIRPRLPHRGHRAPVGPVRISGIDKDRGDRVGGETGHSDVKLKRSTRSIPVNTLKGENGIPRAIRAEYHVKSVRTRHIAGRTVLQLRR